MNIHEQLESFLADLGVEMEQRSEQNEYNDEFSIPEVSIFQASRDHYGVFYRLDIVASKPQLRVVVPVDYGDVKMEIYLVQLGDRTPLSAGFSTMVTARGSQAYEKGRDAARQHLLYAIAETMKQLFWSGDLDRMTFPPEIKVQRLL